MDGNKDAAQRCVDIGNKALQDGDKSRAYRFLTKAQRLDPSLALESLLSSLSEGAEERGSNLSEKPLETDATKTGTGMNGRSCDPAPQAAADYGSDQIEIVHRIRKTKDYYQILGLEKESSSEEVRKAYRKVSLKVHPDKNKAPGSEEAFKAVSKAFACLNDPELRKRYDQYGPEEAHEVAQQQGFRRRRNGAYYEEMFDPNEIFNSFFFGTPYASNGFQRAHFVRAHRAAGQQGGGGHTREVNSGGFLSLLQLLPVLALFFLSFFPFSRPIYSLEQVAPYQFQYRTREHAVPFYVKSQDFDTSYPPGSQSRRSVEAQVERDYTQIIGQHCRRELAMRNWNPSLKTPHCDMLRKFNVY